MSTTTPEQPDRDELRSQAATLMARPDGASEREIARELGISRRQAKKLRSEVLAGGADITAHRSNAIASLAAALAQADVDAAAMDRLDAAPDSRRKRKQLAMLERRRQHQDTRARIAVALIGAVDGAEATAIDATAAAQFGTAIDAPIEAAAANA